MQVYIVIDRTAAPGVHSQRFTDEMQAWEAFCALVLGERNCAIRLWPQFACLNEYYID